MQKNYFSMAIITCIILMGCFKTPTARSSYENVSDQVLDEFMSMRDSVSQKATFKLLTESEKATLWTRHILLVSGRLNLSPEQSNILTSVYRIIDNFYNGSNNVRSDQQLAMKKLEPAILSAFDRGTVYHLFYSVYDPAYHFQKGTTTPESNLLANRAVPADGEGGGGGDCFCSTNSIFCACCGTSPLGTTICSGTTGCTTTTSGCGALFMYPCNGNCIFI